MTNRAQNIMMVAGEASGDQLGAGLMARLTAMHPDISFSGVGGAAMAAQGLESLFPMQEIGLHGFSSVIVHLPNLFRRLGELTLHAERVRPQVIVLIDIPDFNLRLARRVRACLPDARLICYNPPTIWGWRRGRGRKMSALFDHILSLFPFEAEIFANIDKNISCTYTGHPALEKIEVGMQGAAAFRARHKIVTGQRLISILPGSRGREIKAHGEVFGDAVRQIAMPDMRFAMPDMRFAIPLVPHLAARMRQWGESLDVPLIFVESEAERYALYAASDFALVASGTASLELALADTPMVVGYRSDVLFTAVAMRIAQVPSVVLANIILDEPLIAEFLGARCTGENLGNALTRLLRDEAACTAMRAGFARLRALMDTDAPPSQKAAAIVTNYL